jgi:hypothetical protein
MGAGDGVDDDDRRQHGSARRTFDRKTHPDVELLHQAIQSADDRIVELRSAI